MLQREEPPQLVSGYSSQKNPPKNGVMSEVVGGCRRHIQINLYERFIFVIRKIHLHQRSVQGVVGPDVHRRFGSRENSSINPRWGRGVEGSINTPRPFSRPLPPDSVSRCYNRKSLVPARHLPTGHGD